MRNRLLSNPYLRAGLAQLVEQLTLNQLVRGSSPRPGTKNFKKVPVLIFSSLAKIVGITLGFVFVEPFLAP